MNFYLKIVLFQGYLTLSKLHPEEHFCFYGQHQIRCLKLAKTTHQTKTD